MDSCWSYASSSLYYIFPSSVSSWFRFLKDKSFYNFSSSTLSVGVFSLYFRDFLLGFGVLSFEICVGDFLVPRTVASLRSARSERSRPLSTVLGPPCAWTPVYALLSSWKRVASALVPDHLGPPALISISAICSPLLPFFAPIWSSASSNYSKVIFLAARSLTFANIRSTSVVLNPPPISFVSLHSFANYRPSISSEFPVKDWKTCTRSLGSILVSSGI